MGDGSMGRGRCSSTRWWDCSRLWEAPATWITKVKNALCPQLQGVLGADSFSAENEDRQWQTFFQSDLQAATDELDA